jgi:parallel beta-helix repeat protein
MTDANGNIALGVPNTQVITTALLAPFLGLSQSAAELAAGVSPVNLSYAVGDIRRYGAALDGVTNDTTAVQNWLKVGGNLTFPVAQTALISAPVALVSNTTIQAANGATLKIAVNNVNMMTGTNLANVIIRALTFVSTSAVSTVQVAGLYLTGSNNCTVEECIFTGMSFTGIWAQAISYCTIRANNFTGNLGAQTNSSADINVTSSGTTASNYNVIDGNFCFGGGEFGIAVWDPYAGVLPTNNIITNNRIGGCTGYGILIYMPDAGDSYNQVIGNHVENVTGSIASNTSSGAGIYILGNGNGGTVCANNTVRNCCINTANATLAPAGIGVSGQAVGAAPIIVSGNTISDMSQYNGILVTGCNGVTVTGNTIRMPATQTNTGHGIFITNTTLFNVIGNNVLMLSTTQSQSGIALTAIGASYSSGTISGNTISGGHAAQIRFIANGGNTYSHVSITGNICVGGDASSIPLMFDNNMAVDVMVTGNQFLATTAVAISQSGGTNIRYSCNFVNTGGTTALSFIGTNIGCLYDRSNIGSGNSSGVQNTGTGTIIEQLGTAVPSTGTWAVGDTIRNSAPSAAGVYEWINTAAGTPGTWKTISNT